MLSLFKQFPGATLLSLNIILALIWFLNSNPLVQSGYAGADPLIDTDEDDVSRIEIIDPDNDGAIVRLLRGQKLPSQADSKEDEALADQNALEYQWLFEVEKDGQKEQFPADADRLRDLFKDLENTRDYYAIDRSDDRDRELGMGTNNAGQFAGVQIKIWDNPSQSPDTLYIGKTSARGNQSYVRLNTEDDIYIAETNLRNSTGSTEPHYFRNRQVIPGGIAIDQVVQLEARSPAANLDLLLAKSGKDWMIQRPINIPADGSLVSAMLREVLDWKATEFPASMPDDIDDKASLRFSIYFKTAGNMTDQSVLHIDIKARKDSISEYYVKLNGDEQIYKIASTYIADLFAAEERFARRAPGPGPVPGM